MSWRVQKKNRPPKSKHMLHSAEKSQRTLLKHLKWKVKGDWRSFLFWVKKLLIITKRQAGDAKQRDRNYKRSEIQMAWALATPLATENYHYKFTFQERANFLDISVMPKNKHKYFVRKQAHEWEYLAKKSRNIISISIQYYLKCSKGLFYITLSQ